MTTPKHCPGFDKFRELESFVCTCPECGKENEIFSDEFDKQRFCSKCGKQIDFKKCTLYAKGDSLAPR